MGLTDEQVRVIRAWAGRTPQVREVRLFGSRAKGCARVDSDVDLAITASDDNYFTLASRWEQHPSPALGLNVVIRNPAHHDVVRRSCDERSILLFPTVED